MTTEMGNIFEDGPLSTVVKMSQQDPLTEKQIEVPVKFIQMLGSVLAKFQQYVPEDMRLPSIGVTVKNREE